MLVTRMLRVDLAEPSTDGLVGPLAAESQVSSDVFRCDDFRPVLHERSITPLHRGSCLGPPVSPSCYRFIPTRAASRPKRSLARGHLLQGREVAAISGEVAKPSSTG